MAPPSCEAGGECPDTALPELDVGPDSHPVDTSPDATDSSDGAVDAAADGEGG
jgi:hypothetical protein